MMISIVNLFSFVIRISQGIGVVMSGNELCTGTAETETNISAVILSVSMLAIETTSTSTAGVDIVGVSSSISSN
ncbi:hypothetical protein A2U01_0088148, partial [Trifolium medium]|nr:hypothetical protein [Trifolium medium]